MGVASRLGGKEEDVFATGAGCDTLNTQNLNEAHGHRVEKKAEEFSGNRPKGNIRIWRC